jgi:predicted O-methyltransferase YrrM
MITEIIKTLFPKNSDISNCLYPLDRRMSILKDKYNIDGMSTENIRLVINELVKIFAKNGLYVEVGTYQGCSLLSAALFNPSTICYGIDNFSQFDHDNINKDILIKNIEISEVKNVRFYEGDYSEVIPAKFSEKSIDVYFYDGEHSYDSQISGLNIIKPYLKDTGIIIVDDASWPEPRKANNDWLKDNPEYSILELSIKNYDIEKNCNNPYWWNGLSIFYKRP